MTPSRRHPNHRELSSLPVELRRTTVPPAVRAWIERETGRAVTSARRLPGASSAAMHRIGLDGDHRLVLRRYVWRHYLDVEPTAPAREVDGLGFAHEHGLAVPEVVATDLDGAAIGDGVPAILMSFVAGQPVAVPDLVHLAEVAASIHDVDPTGYSHEYFRWYAGEQMVPPDDTARPGLWETAIDTWINHRPAFTPTFIHRDFHPGNVLWSRGRATGIVDWANACAGPCGCDIAHCRWNLINLSGLDAADSFLAAYEAATGKPYDPFWELGSVLEHDREHFTAERLPIDERRLEHALAALGRL